MLFGKPKLAPEERAHAFAVRLQGETEEYAE